MFRKSKLFLLPIFALSIGVLTGCDDQIKALSEDVQSQIDSIKTDIEDLKNQIAEIKEQISTLQTEMDGKIAELKEEYTKKIADAEAEIVALTKSLDDLDKQFAADKKAIEDDYDAKIGALEANYLAKVEEIESNIATINANIANIQDELNKKINDIQNDYNQKINELTERVSILEEVTTHTVSFDTKGGNEIASQVIVHGEKARKPENPVRAGANFEGWYYHDEPWYFYSSVVTEDMELVAGWELINYRAVFKNDDGTILDTIEGLHYGDSITYSGETPVKPNPEEHYIYTFDGWDKDLVVTGDMELVAQYKKEYTPYEEKYLDASGNIHYQRYVAEENLLTTINFNGQDIEPKDGQHRLEAEDAILSAGGVRADVAENASGGRSVGYFDTGTYVKFVFSASQKSIANFIVCIANGGGQKMNKYLKRVTLNDEEYKISDGILIKGTNDWDTYLEFTVGEMLLKDGENTVVIYSNGGINLDYIAFEECHFEPSLEGIENPTKDNDESVVFQFYKWELLSNENNIAIFAPVFEKATIGLELLDNKVDVYHGAATEVFVPAFWNGSKITEVGENCFGDTSVVEVHLPDTIELISGAAFKLATKLKTVNFPKNLKSIEYEAFYECVKLQKAEFNDGLEFIGNRSFQYSGLKEVTFPSSVKHLGERCFANIQAEFIYVPSTVSEIMWGCFQSSEDYINVIYCEREFRTSAFDPNWATNSEIVWGYKSEIEQDGYKYAIYEIDEKKAAILLGYDPKITEFEIPEKVNGIPVEKMHVSFKNNSTLKRVILPNCIDTVSRYMFEGCSSLTYVEVPENVSTISESAFSNLYNLETVVLHEGLEVIDNNAFQNCTSLSSVTLPDGLIALKAAAFAGCSSLTTINFPSTIRIIENAIFQSTALSFIDLPDSVTVIPEAMFLECTSLTSIVLPGTLKSIAGYAFYCCFGVQKIFFRGTEEQWNSVAPYDEGTNHFGSPTFYFYSEGEPATPGNFWRYVEGAPTIW